MNGWMLVASGCTHKPSSNIKIREIAEFMGCSENTVKSRLNYAKHTMEAEISEKLRELIKGKRSTYDTYVQEKLQKHFAEKFQNRILMKAKESAPDLPEADGAEFHQTKSHRR